jgi:hypothetical protein
MLAGPHPRSRSPFDKLRATLSSAEGSLGGGAFQYPRGASSIFFSRSFTRAGFAFPCVAFIT